jgi:hypothetical protein
VELGGLLKFLKLFQSMEAAGHIAKRDVGKKRIRVEGIL